MIKIKHATAQIIQIRSTYLFKNLQACELRTTALQQLADAIVNRLRLVVVGARLDLELIAELGSFLKRRPELRVYANNIFSNKSLCHLGRVAQRLRRVLYIKPFAQDRRFDPCHDHFTRSLHFCQIDSIV